jgi:hypothetical protein
MQTGSPSVDVHGTIAAGAEIADNAEADFSIAGIAARPPFSPELV